MDDASFLSFLTREDSQSVVSHPMPAGMGSSPAAQLCTIIKIRRCAVKLGVKKAPRKAARRRKSGMLCLYSGPGCPGAERHRQSSSNQRKVS